MFFNKIRHPANFVFAEASPEPGGRLDVGNAAWSFRAEALGADVHRLRLWPNGGWTNPSQMELDHPGAEASSHALLWDQRGLRLVDSRTHRVVLEGTPGATFGQCGPAWMLQFRHHSSMQFFGLGEHSAGWEKTGQRVKFWNNDMWAEHSLHEIRVATPNPMYISIPWLIVRQDDLYIGLFVHHPGAVFMDLASSFIWSPENQEDRARQSFFVGAPDGGAELYVLVGPSLAELTRKFQTLVGRTPRPPLWALGHQQCRWGYGGPDDLRELDRKFAEHDLPTDGLWLDIDYMQRYKVFTWNTDLWGDEGRVQDELTRLAGQGRRVVPILDPGVKLESGYEVMEDGLRRGIFCLNPAGLPYVGFVWPGRTYYPDFSLPEARAWWAERVKAFANLGVGGAWLDMNDPSVGAVELEDMLFDRGRLPHEAYHNQYALGMAKASHEGFLAARPDERPFLLSRSACPSSSRYTAVWLGDNYSNWHHLRNSIPLSLGLALSGQPFNGPDVAGFGDDTTPELAMAWYKAGFLFPFFRNHTTHGSRRQEPWALGPTALGVMGKFIRLRYRLLPYLYQLFVEQEGTGEAILRPLMYHYEDDARHQLSLIRDQFLVGPSLLQAPLLEEGAKSREVVLPGRRPWFGAHDGAWHKPGRLTVSSGRLDTPLYFAEGALVPLHREARSGQRLQEIDLLVVLGPDSGFAASGRYVADDGLTYGYRRGAQTVVHWTASFTAGGLEFEAEVLETGAGPLSVSLVMLEACASVSVRVGGVVRTLRPRRSSLQLSGRRFPCWCTRAVTL